MTDIAEPLRRIWDQLRGSPAKVTTSIAVPPDKVSGSGKFAPKFTPGKQYFSVVINEIFATQARQWFKVYDPACFVIAEYAYDGRRIEVPFVVGPSMLKGKAAITPNGISITDTRVAGMNPFVGGSFALTLIVAEVQRESYARRLLDFMSSVSAAFPLSVALGAHLKVAGSLLDSVESLLGLTETKAVAAHRFEYNDGETPWLKPGFWALLAEDENVARSRALWVVDGHLREAAGADAAGFRQADFVLYSLCTHETRSDVTQLPFYPRFKQALRDAGSLDEGAWDRAKAGLVTLYQDLLTSPDLTWDDAHAVMQEFKKQLVEVHEQVAKFEVLSTDENAVKGPASSDPRQAELGAIHELLKL